MQEQHDLQGYTSPFATMVPRAELAIGNVVGALCSSPCYANFDLWARVSKE